MEEHRVRLVVTDDGRRSRLTVLFRLPLAIIHLLWLFLWTILAFFAVVSNWAATLATGTPPRGLHGFLAAYVRYTTHLYAYLYLVADPFPGFNGTPRSYPVDVEIPPPLRQNRWRTAFRLVLALPPLLLASALAGGVPQRAETSDGSVVATSGWLGTLVVIALLGWFACLARGWMPRGMRDLGAYALGYGAQVWAYLFVLTERYPNSDPAAMLDTVAAPEHPVTVRHDDDRRRSRLMVFFRLPLAFPHFAWLLLWTIPALLAAVANWLATLVTGRSPRSLHRFLAAFVRYATHVNTFLYVVANPFPGFTGRAGSYPLDVEIDPLARQSRWITGFRVLLALPALLIAGAFGNLLVLIGIGCWFCGLFTARVPGGLRNLGIVALRYSAQVWAYVFLLTDRYPYAGPTDASIGLPPVPPPPPDPSARVDLAEPAPA